VGSLSKGGHVTYHSKQRDTHIKHDQRGIDNTLVKRTHQRRDETNNILGKLLTNMLVCNQFIN
jgi:hypothetical protein